MNTQLSISTFRMAAPGRFLFSALALLAVLVMPQNLRAEWTLHEVFNQDKPGKSLEVREHGELVARLVFGEGQSKPYLHVYGDEGDLLTRWSPTQTYPHHRGIFIGWLVISELGRDDLWHMRDGAVIEVLNFETLKTSGDSATIVAQIAWRASNRDDAGSNLLLNERRTLTISRPAGGGVRVDADFSLTAARPLRFAGDLQHSGVHLRTAPEVFARGRETSYLTEPDGVTQGDNLKWCRFQFPIGDRWYSALQLNAPSNPVEELSTRGYGRFGYFFRKPFETGETLDISYRFILSRTEAPAERPRLSPEQAARARAEADAHYNEFTRSLDGSGRAAAR